MNPQSKQLSLKAVILSNLSYLHTLLVPKFTPTFLALDDTTESLRSSCKEALGIDTSAIFKHKLELARSSKAWSSAKIAAETKQKIDAIHRAHGEPVQMLEGDWANMIRAFKLKYGKQIHPSRLPAQSYYEAYEEKLANTTWRAETLAHVTSLQEEKQKALRPEPSRSVGIHLDSSLSIQTQRRFVAKMPTNIEDLRTQYKVMATMFLLAKMRQPSRHLYKDLEVNTFSDFLDELLSDRNMEGGDDDNLSLPPWSECLNFGFQIRKEAVRLCMEEGFSIKDSLWHTLADKERRMQHWILKLTIANSRQESSKMQKMEQRFATLENRLKNRSRSPRRQQNQLPANMLLCLRSRCWRYLPQAHNRKASPKARKVAKARAKAKAKETRHNLRTRPPHRVSATSRHCTNSGGQFENTSRRTHVGNSNQTSARMQAALANMLALDAAKQMSIMTHAVARSPRSLEHEPPHQL